MTCPSCAAVNPAGSKFCNECGARLALICAACQTLAPPGARFCGECGSPLAADASGSSAGPSGEGHAVERTDSVRELRPVSVLFVDLVGFTALSEHRDAEDVRELLSDYFAAARTVIERYAGTVEKFIGDAVMAVWGSPVAREDDAERAVRAGLELLDAVAALAETMSIPTLQARAGVVTGQAASWGSGAEALVVGDRVNTAARVQALAEPGAVLVDDVTRQRSLASIAYADAGVHRLKGKDEPLQVWRAQRVVAGAFGNDRVDGLEAMFLGRDPELRLVKDLFHGATERGQARMALVVGAPGMGKSRLLSEFGRYIDGLAAETFWHVGRCLSYGDGVAYWALVEAVRQRLQIPEDASDAQAEERLDAGLANYVPDPQAAAYLRPRLAALLGLPGGDGLDRQDLMAGWRTFFERLAEEDPVVLVFEDLQWADTALLDFLDHLLEWAASSPIFVLGLARPELLERRTSWVAGRRGLTVLWLDRLPAKVIGNLLGELVPGMPDELRSRIVAQAEGIPLYAVESVRALVDRGQVIPQGGRYVLVGEVAALDVPPSLTSLLAARLDALAPDERAVAMRMSVFRGGFSREAVLAVAGTPEGRIEAVLASLVRRDVLTVQSSRLSPDQGQYAFRQAMLRQVAYDMLGKHERKARHLAAAQHLTTTFADGADVGEVLASHYRGAYDAVPEDPDAETIRRSAHRAYVAAGERGLAVGSPDVAERSFAMAALLTDGADRTTARLRAAQAALEAGRTRRALDYAELVIDSEVEADPRRWGEAQLVAARAHGKDGRFTEGLGASQAIIDRFPEPSDEERPLVAHALARHAFVQTVMGQFDAAEQSVDSALRIAEWIGDREQVAEALNAKATLMMATDRPIEAMVSFEGALRCAADPSLIGLLHTNAGDLALQVDDPESVSHLEVGLERARRRGDRQMESICVINLAQLDLLHGDWGRGQASLEDHLKVIVEFGYGMEVQLGLRLVVGAFLRFGGDLASLDEQLLTLPAELESEDFWEIGLQRWLELARSAMRGDDVVDALAAQAEAGLRYGMRTDPFRYVWVDALGEAQRAGRPEVVDRLLRLLGDRPGGGVPPFLRAQRMRYQGLRAADSGDRTRGDDLLRQAVEVLDGLGYPYWVACAKLDRASVLGAGGQADVAGQLRAEAETVLRGLGAGHVLAEGAAALLEDDPMAGRAAAAAIATEAT